MIRILGLDVGSVRVGVALSDPLGLTAQPLEVIDRRGGDPFARVVELVEKHGVQRIVVGKPLRLDGTAGRAVQSTEEFVQELRRRVNIPVEMWDERLSTAEAERIMIDNGVSRNRRRKSIDRIAAALILQSYLDAGR